MTTIIENNCFITIQSLEDVTKFANLHFNAPGCYLLLGDQEVYVGQACGQSMKSRIKQHIKDPKKRWMNTVVSIGMLDAPFTPSIANIVESKLISIFNNLNSDLVQNKTIGNLTTGHPIDIELSNKIITTFKQNIGKIIDVSDWVTLKPKELTEVKVDVDPIDENTVKEFLKEALPKLESTKFPTNLLFIYFKLWLHQHNKNTDWSSQRFLKDVKNESLSLGWSYDSVKRKFYKSINKSDYDALYATYLKLGSKTPGLPRLAPYEHPFTENILKQRNRSVKKL